MRVASLRSAPVPRSARRYLVLGTWYFDCRNAKDEGARRDEDEGGVQDALTRLSATHTPLDGLTAVGPPVNGGTGTASPNETT